ncbi:hypothetical protein RhiJN_18109 [Ceratobasidium sp. AG-Ba]|nr:hypothetical protein RhiJN_18109 [Ceratobasidium sp. AG-Ba]
MFRALDFLKEPLEKTLNLESLTIGTGFQTPEGRILPKDNFKVNCPKLRINAYYASPVLVSTRLTVLEVTAEEPYGGWNSMNIEKWAELLAQNPSLVHVKLTNSGHGLNSWERNLVAVFNPINLVALQTLELSGVFFILTKLFTEDSLPALDCLLLNWHGEIPPPLADHLPLFLSGLSTLQRLDICSLSSSWFGAALRFHLKLSELTFFEMLWDEVEIALNQLAGGDSRPRIHLERIWDINSARLDELGAVHGVLPIELRECYSRTGRECNGECTNICYCKLESDYSDTSSHYDTSQYSIFSSSEEIGWDGSERSYGADELHEISS